MGFKEHQHDNLSMLGVQISILGRTPKCDKLFHHHFENIPRIRTLTQLSYIIICFRAIRRPHLISMSPSNASSNPTGSVFLRRGVLVVLSLFSSSHALSYFPLARSHLATRKPWPRIPPVNRLLLAPRRARGAQKERTWARGFHSCILPGSPSETDPRLRSRIQT